MFHHVAHAVGSTLLFHDWEEGRALWDLVIAPLPGLIAACDMPDHVHAATRRPERDAFVRGMRAFARYRNERRGERGRVWRTAPPPDPITEADKRERMARYIELNALRAALVDDPLAWPFGTARESTGLAWPAAREARPDPDAWYARLCSDPSAKVVGVALPCPRRCPPGPEGVRAVAHAVSAILRVPLPRLRQRGPARSLFLRAARVLCDVPSRMIGDEVCLTGAAVRRVEAVADAQVRLVERVVGDPRFPALREGDLRSERAWRDYVARREWARSRGLIR